MAISCSATPLRNSSRNLPTRRSASRTTASSSLMPLKRAMTIQDLLAAHFRHHLRPYRQRLGAAALSAVAAAQPQDHQRRTRRPGREPAIDVPARRRMELQPLHRHSRPHHRSRHRKDAERVPDRANSGAAANGRDRVSHRQRECRSSCRAVPGRSLDRRKGAALQHAGKAGDGIRRRRPGLHHHGLRPVLPDAAQRRRARRRQDHRPQDAATDGVRSPRSPGQGRLSV